MLRNHSKSVFISLFLLSGLLIAGPAAAQSGVAKVGANGALLASGGGDTTSVSVAHTASSGYYEVTFNGTYTLSFGANSVIINSTAESTQWGVTNAYVVSATANQIIVGVYTWQSFTSFDLRDNTFFVSMQTT